METLTLEVLGRFGRVRSRHRLAQFPATLGRRLDNDVILDEPDVSALHARVVRGDDGALTLEDAKSANGLKLDGKRVASVRLEHDVRVSLGSTVVRFVSTEAPVPKTLLFRRSPLDRWLAVGAGVVAFALLESVEDWYLKSTRVRPSEVVETIAGVTIVLGGGWAFVWSLASRIAHGKSRVVGHLAAAMIGLAGIEAVALALPYGPSVLGLGPTGAWLSGLIAYSAVLGWLLVQNLTRVVSWSRRRVLAGVGALWVLGAGLAAVTRLAETSKYNAQLPLGGLQPPPALLLGRTAPGPELGERIARLRRQVDADRGEH